MTSFIINLHYQYMNSIIQTSLYFFMPKASFLFLNILAYVCK